VGGVKSCVLIGTIDKHLWCGSLGPSEIEKKEEKNVDAWGESSPRPKIDSKKGRGKGWVKDEVPDGAGGAGGRGLY